MRLGIGMHSLCALISVNSNSNSTFIVLNLHWVVDSKAQQDNSNMQIQSPGTEIGRQHGEAIRETELRRISRCVEIGFELLSKRGNSGSCTNVFRKWITNSGSIKGETETVNYSTTIHTESVTDILSKQPAKKNLIIFIILLPSICFLFAYKC